MRVGAIFNQDNRQSNILPVVNRPKSISQNKLSSVRLKCLSADKFDKVAFKGKNVKLISGLFKDFAVNENNPLWKQLIQREAPLYKKTFDTRSPFVRDYDRILHSSAYNKLAGKTQVFIAPKLATTSTRMFHVNQVASIAQELSGFFGLNQDLARAGAIGHDLGHTPFGHEGERLIGQIIKKYDIKSNFWNGEFWHEKNSLRFIDKIETKLNPKGQEENLNLTYATRAAIIGHCGEIPAIGLPLSKELPVLSEISKNNRPNAQTWEGAVVRVSDKIAYLGKDIEDAINNKFWAPGMKKELLKFVKQETGEVLPDVNNTVLINRFIRDVKESSSPGNGLGFSEEGYKVYRTIKKFNYDNLYIPADNIQNKYMELVLNTVFERLDSLYTPSDFLKRVQKEYQKIPYLTDSFRNWMVKYSDISPKERQQQKYKNKIIYNIKDQNNYRIGIIDFISSLADKEIINHFNEITFCF